jgi:ribosomal protein S18 acetylase RimI-like enzyme
MTTSDQPRCEFTDAPAEADLKVVDAGLSRFNHAAADLTAVRPLACFARDAEGSVVGGVRARQWGAALEVQVLWVDESRRRQGVATRLMRLLEDEARRRGAKLAYLDTFSFQARGFYERLGYAVAARLDGFPDGIEKYLMTRRLDGGA